MTPEMVACGPDSALLIAKIQAYVDAGFDEIYVGHIGPGHDAFLEFYARDMLPEFA